MSIHDGNKLVEDGNAYHSYNNYGFTSISQPDVSTTRTPGYSQSYAIKFPASNLASKADQKASNYGDYGNCYAPQINANSTHSEFHRDDQGGKHNEAFNQSTANSAHGVSAATGYPQARSHLYNLEQLNEVHARRAENRAQKQYKSVDPITEQLARVEPIEVTFLDRKQGIEYDAYGRIIDPSAFDASAPVNPDFSGDAIHPYSEPPQYDVQLQDRIQPAPVRDYAQPASGHLQPFQEWHAGVNPTGQRGEQHTPPWLTPQKPPTVPNYTIFSIVACLFFLPIGGAALGYVIKSSKLRKERKYQAAIDSARTAYKLCILAIVFGVISMGVSGFLVWYQIQRINKILSPQT